MLGIAGSRWAHTRARARVHARETGAREARIRERAARAGLAAVCAGAVLLGGAGSAGAGEYHVYSCRMPDGTVAPTDGWTSSSTGVADIAENGCKQGKALVVALDAGTTHPAATDTATWEFKAPSGDSLMAATLWRSGDADGGLATNATYEFWLAGSANTEVFDECVYEFGCQSGKGDPSEPFSTSNRVAVPAKNLGTNLFLNASCGGIASYTCPSTKGDANGYAAVVYLYAADLVLEQTAQPTVAGVSGELANAPTATGTQDLAFEASDPGSGVYQAVFSVDGTVVGRTLLSENGGRCKDAGQTSDGLPAFLYVQPCAASVRADVPFDTTTLANGAHHLVVSVTDAAGNPTVALDRRIEVANATATGGTTPGGASLTGGTGVSGSTLGPENGSHATAAATLSARWAATPRPALRGTYGHAQLVSGRVLTPGGQPIAGAQVQASFLPSYQGAAPRQLPAAVTGADGSFRLRLPASTPSGRVTLAYSSHAGQPAPDVTASLTLTVPASLSLRVSPAVSHAGGTIVFTGVLHGAPLPGGGKQLVLEARAFGPGTRSPWRQFQVLATARHGRFRAGYRFRLPGPVAYQFRAVCPHEADFPYATAASRPARVFER